MAITIDDFKLRTDVNPSEKVYTYELNNDQHIVKISTVNNGRNFQIMFIIIGKDKKRYMIYCNYAESIDDAINQTYKAAQDFKAGKLSLIRKK